MKNLGTVSQPLCFAASAITIAMGVALAFGGKDMWTPAATVAIAAVGILAYAASATGMLQRVSWEKVASVVMVGSLAIMVLLFLCLIAAMTVAGWMEFYAGAPQVALGVILAVIGCVLGASCRSVRDIAGKVDDQKYWSAVTMIAMFLLFAAPLAYHVYQMQVAIDAIRTRIEAKQTSEASALNDSASPNVTPNGF